METTLKKWGNSPAVRLPAALMRTAGFAVDQPVQILAHKGRIVIEPAQRPVTYALADLLAGISSENTHPELELGGPMGREAW